ncbi:phosphoribosylglycinamide formyltransferase [Bartonella sp. DGB1]|uniref:phosphoribosylglycinamide formyltransferase n=1 Tax=Bartonella sp. DGB1 TaxID=3239807 RepID=UPI0035247BE2
MKKHKIAILISGSGSNMESLIKYSLTDESTFEITKVISNNINALGLKKAANYNIKNIAIDRNNYQNKAQHEQAMLTELKKDNIDLICLAGYMQLLSSDFIGNYQNKILNIHPSLLPLFKGLDTYNKAIESGMKFTGCTVHIVTEKMDEGKIIAQAVVPIFKHDTSSDLQQRILNAEHLLYYRAIEQYLNNIENNNINNEDRLINL